jgi:hypothetical protein
VIEKRSEENAGDDRQGTPEARGQQQRQKLRLVADLAERYNEG